MGKKQWYEIWLISNQDDYKEMVAKIKSQGLANITLNHYKDIYKNTIYKVILK